MNGIGMYVDAYKIIQKKYDLEKVVLLYRFGNSDNWEVYGHDALICKDLLDKWKIECSLIKDGEDDLLIIPYWVEADIITCLQDAGKQVWTRVSFDGHEYIQQEDDGPLCIDGYWQ
jgi:hypothetical protein